MNSKQLSLTAMILLTAVSLTAAEKQTLKIYLPREVTIEDQTPTIGQIAIVRGDKSMTEEIEAVVVGRFSTPDQQLVVDKNVILSRLACSDIDISRITLTGAEKTVVKRQHQTISGNAFVQKAAAFLNQNPPHQSACEFDVLRAPGDVVLPSADDNIKMTCRLVSHGIKNQCKVQVSVFQNDRCIARDDVTFAMRYQSRKIIAQTPIAKGQPLTADNITIETGVSNVPQPPGWTPPYGQVANRSITAGTSITDNMITSPKPEVILKRNQNVTIRIESAGFVATAVGKVLQDGICGEYIKVQNIDSKIILTAKVNDDGTVEPIF